MRASGDGVGVGGEKSPGIQIPVGTRRKTKEIILVALARWWPPRRRGKSAGGCSKGTRGSTERFIERS